MLKLKSKGYRRVLVLKIWAKYFPVKCIEAATEDVLQKNLFIKNLENFTGKHFCWSIYKYFL